MRNLCDACKECEDNDKSILFCFGVCGTPIDILHNIENERNDKALECKAERDEVRTCANCKHYKRSGKEFPCIDCMMDCKDRFEESEDKE